MCLKRSLFRYKYGKIYNDNDLLYNKTGGGIYKIRYAIDWLLLKVRDMYIKGSWYESSTLIF